MGILYMGVFSFNKIEWFCFFSNLYFIIALQAYFESAKQKDCGNFPKFAYLHPFLTILQIFKFFILAHENQKKLNDSRVVNE